MNIINVDQIDRKIDVGEYKTAIIYDRHYSNIPGNASYFERYDCESIEDLKSRMKDFCNEYSGMFSIVLKKAKGGSMNASCLCRVNIQATAAAPEMNGTQQPFVNAEQLKAQWMTEFKSQMKTDMLQAQVNMYQAQLGEQSTMAGKMGLMIEQFFMAKMGKAAPMFQQNGTLNGTVEVQNAEDSEVEDEDLGKALIAIKDKFGAANLVKIQKKIEEGDPTIQMIINSLNNG